ncbi:MAG: glycerophosphodiester phosphodiesterase [bacterium]|nr:glycerophosphodiester phosphodiesterase [bacterium]
MDATAPFLALESPLRFAHRGSRVLWPENTMVAFQGAVDLGYRYIETDVRISKDGHVVVFHDETLQRTTDGIGKVIDRNLDELRLLDAGHQFAADQDYPLRGGEARISTLAEVFGAFPDVHFNIDLKGAGMEWPVADVIEAAGRQESTLIGSFVDRRIAKFRRITRGHVATSAGPTAALSMWAASRVGRHIKRPVAAYQLPFDYKSLPLDGKYIAAIHDAGAQVHAWTVNEAPDMERLLDMGVDGIVTDRPDILNEVLGRRGLDV